MADKKPWGNYDGPGSGNATDSQYRSVLLETRTPLAQRRPKPDDIKPDAIKAEHERGAKGDPTPSR